ncbi:hypothetical protein ACHQM5_000552 [Ranunculus cassubicifolius]
MYATRLLSMCRKFPSLLAEPAVEAPNSGYLVITDEETELEDTCCFGMCDDPKVRELPFPVNKIVNVEYRTGTGNHRRVERDKVWFIPVLDQPLSSNQYYVIRAKGKYKGQTCTCSKEEDAVTVCFCNCGSDVKPRALNYRDIYQQVEVFKKPKGILSDSGFSAKSVAPDGSPPRFLRRKGWTVHYSSSYQYYVSEAHGLNFTLRPSLPDFHFQISEKRSSSVIVGNWYCPFVFIKEQERPKDQMKNSLLYTMTLEKFWEEIFTCENVDISENNVLDVDASVQREVASIYGMEAIRDDRSSIDGTVWYTNIGSDETVASVGLSAAIVEKMRWIQEMGGWIAGEETVRVQRREVFEGREYRWKRFGCFVLVERFALRRMDRTLILTCDYRYMDHIQTKWE